jgi:hypothetical protein
LSLGSYYYCNDLSLLFLFQCISKKSEEAKDCQSRTHWQAVSRDHDLATHQHAQAISQNKEKEHTLGTQSSTTFHKGKVFTKSTSSLTSSWAKYE